MPPINLPARIVLDFAAAGITGHLVDWSVTHDGAILVLTADPPPQWGTPGSKNMFAKDPRHAFFAARSPTPIRYTATIVERGRTCTVTFPRTRENFTFLRRLSPRELLLVRGRLRKGERQLDGAVYSITGKPGRRILVGDAIEHLFVARDGSIWVGFYDEAYFNDRSRGGGLIRINSRGKLLFSLSQTFTIDSVDIYAMAMNRDGSVVVCPYAYFELATASLAGKVKRHGISPLRGSQTLAVRGTTAILDHGYDAHDKLSLVDLRTLKTARVNITGVPGATAPPRRRFGINGTRRRSRSAADPNANRQKLEIDPHPVHTPEPKIQTSPNLSMI